MAKHTITLATICVFAFVGIGYLSYQNYSANKQVEEINQTVASLNEVISTLTDNMANMSYIKSMEDEAYESSVMAADKKLVEQSKKLEELTREKDRLTKELAATKKSLLSAQRTANNYRSRYITEKNSAENAKLVMSQQLEQEKVALEAKTQKELKMHLSELEGEYSEQALKAETEQRVDELMTDFGKLRVDLDLLNKCDAKYLERHGEAKSILNHMRTYIQQYELSQDYYFFVISNDSQLARKTRELCIKS